MVPRRHAVAAGLTLVVVLSAVAATAYVSSRRTSRHEGLTAAELTSYTGAVLPPLREGGRVVEQEMKPTIGDLVSGKLTGTTFAGRVDTWLADLSRVRGEVAAVPPPAELRPAATGFDDALGRYLAAAEAFRAAALAPAARRQAALDHGYAVATEADHRYDTASAVIQGWRRRLGLGPTADFPDPTPTPTPEGT
jgi:hypothetical protein